MQAVHSVEVLLRRDRWVVAGGVAGAVALAWAYQLYMVWGMEHGSTVIAMLMPNTQSWTAFDAFLLFVMWVLMMVAMMLPSVAPTVLAFAEVNRRRREQQSPFVRTGVFLSGYLTAWVGFSLVATAAQLALHTAALLSPAMVARSPVLGAGLLFATGVFQWTPLKQACLSRCRSPLGFVLTHWREGAAGAFGVGLLHGAYCTGCCALLMALLFVNGVMNIAWIAVLTLFVLAEKLLPWPIWPGRLAGLLLCIWGALVLTAR